MANPIIKIKRGTGKPVDYLETLSGSTVVSTAGLTAGELGVDLTANNYSFYIGNNEGKAITFGCEVSTDTSLATNSDYKLPTQKAVKTYIDANAGSPSSASAVLSKYATAAVSVGADAIGTITFGATDYQFPATGIPNLAYAASGTFTNTGGSTMYLLITYQVTWSGFALNSESYTSRNIIRSAWIQRTGFANDTGSGGQLTVDADNIYGFTSLLCPPLVSTSDGALTGTQNGSAIIELPQFYNFKINVKNHAAGTQLTSLTANNNPAGTGAWASFANRACNIQIAKL